MCNAEANSLLIACEYIKRGNQASSKSASELTGLEIGPYILLYTQYMPYEIE